MNSESNEKHETTIALFGATGRTGREFLKLALQQGFFVKTLVRDPHKLEQISSDTKHRANTTTLTVVQGSLEDTDKLEQVVLGSTYVVCMVAAPGNDSSHPRGFMTNFIKSLHPILERSKPKVLLYQAGSMSVDGHGKLHPLSFVAKHTLGRKLQIMNKIADNDEAIQCIQRKHEHHCASLEPSYSFIVTRAGVLVDGPPTSNAKVASLTWPPLPYWNSMTFGDLAEITLQVIQDQSLLNKCPYIR